MTDILVPIFICVVLPVFIVWLVTRARQHEIDKKTEIMLKAIESGAPVDPELFKTKQRVRTIKQDLLDKLTGACVTTFMGVAFLVIAWVDFNNPQWGKGRLWFMQMSPLAGGIMLAVGIALFVSYFAGKKMLAKEIEAEEKNLQA